MLLIVGLAAVSSQAFPVAVVCIWISLHSTSTSTPSQPVFTARHLDTLSTSLHSTSPRHPLNQSSQHVYLDILSTSLHSTSTSTPSQPIFTARHLDTLSTSLHSTSTLSQCPSHDYQLSMLWLILSTVDTSLSVFRFITFRVIHRRHEMYTGHSCLCVCPRPHAHASARTRM